MSDLNRLELPELFERLCAGGRLARLMQLAHEEDLGETGDAASAAMFDETHRSAALLRARRGGVIAGLEAGPPALAAFGPSVRWTALAADGERAEAGATLARLEGPTIELLGAERTLLNLIGRLSGIATKTAEFVERVRGTRASIYDTRKTTPGMRALEKYAVRCGGGTMHRIGLYDGAMFKDNHLAGLRGRVLAERLATACARVRGSATVRFVEVEVDTLEQLGTVLGLEKGLVDVILLDNMGADQLREAVRMRDGAGSSIELEASGGVTLERVREIAETGVERISVGELTHTVRALDVGLDFV